MAGRVGKAYYINQWKEIFVDNYRKKPVVIQATVWPGGDEGAMQEFVASHEIPEDVIWHGGDNDLIIDTLEGQMKADPGDFIIKGVAGEYYPCKPDIFHKSYDPAL